MEIKDCMLEEEFIKVKNFLNSFDLSLDELLDHTFYLEDNGLIIGTISLYKYIIKDLAVSDAYQGENLSGKLISHAINYLQSKGINSYCVFTKPKNESIFTSLGFRKIVKTSDVLFLEGGIRKIEDEIKQIKNQIEFSLAPLSSDLDIASVVLNANPITLGHVHLVEEASLHHKIVIVFIVEEDESKFTFEQRFSLAYLALKKFSNVCVVRSSVYMVSNATFPTYFLKKEIASFSYAAMDATIFKEYFMKELFIKYRYVGIEESLVMTKYNNTLKEVLGTSLIEIPRLKVNDEIVSASKVRSYLENKEFDKIYDFIPLECASLLIGLYRN